MRTLTGTHIERVSHVQQHLDGYRLVRRVTE